MSDIDVCIVLPHLEAGGAETSTIKLVSLLSGCLGLKVFTLKSDGVLAAQLDEERLISAPGWGRLMRLLQAWLFLRDSKVKLIISRVWFANFFCLVLFRKKTIIYEDSIPSELAKYVPFGALKLSMLRFLYKKARGIVAVSPAVRTDLCKMGISEERVHVIPNPVHFSCCGDIGIRTDKKVVAYIGSRKALKGWGIINLLARGFSEQYGDCAEMHVFGGEMCLREPGVTDHGVLPPTSIPYNNVDYLLIPSLVKESFCNVFHEAMRSKAIVVCNRGILPYPDSVLGELGVYQYEQGLEGLKEKLSCLMNSDVVLTAEQISNRDQFLCEFSDEVVRMKVLDLIGSCAG